MWGRVTILAALGLTWMIAGQGRAAAGDMSGVREAVATVIRNLPDDVRVRVFDYDPEAVRDLDLDSAELLGRAGLSKSESAYTINLDEWGGGYLIAAGTDFLLCNIKYGSVRSCFLIPVYRYEEMRCEKATCRHANTFPAGPLSAPRL